MKKLVSAAGAVLLLVSSPLFAHHSFAMFDLTQKVLIEGKISDIQWTNPHVWIHVDVANKDGSVVTWPLELTSIVHLTRRGFPKNQLAVGDSGTFMLSPYANGKPGGRFYAIELDKGVLYLEPGAQRDWERLEGGGAQSAAAQ